MTNDGHFNGFGRFIFSNTGSTYIGWWKDSKQFGNGNLITEGASTQGFWNDQKKLSEYNMENNQYPYFQWKDYLT